MSIEDKFDQILKALERIEARQLQGLQKIEEIERIEARQLQGLQKIEETAPPEVGSFASSS